MAAQGRSMAFLLLATFALLSVVNRASATDYDVGAEGWIVPSPKTYYDDWLADKKFVTGDVLVFKYPAGGHTVLQVSKEAYPACTMTSPIASYETGADDVTLATAGDYYFICGVSTHCALGQKFTVTVAGKSATPSPKAAPSNSTTPPAGSPGTGPTKDTASGLNAAGALVCSVLMVLVASLLY